MEVTKVIEVPVERMVEVPVTQVVEVPRIIEKTVEVQSPGRWARTPRPGCGGGGGLCPCAHTFGPPALWPLDRWC